MSGCTASSKLDVLDLHEDPAHMAQIIERFADAGDQLYRLERLHRPDDADQGGDHAVFAAAQVLLALVWIQAAVAGPVGPAGLELIYAVNDQMEMGLGGAYRSYRFRLDDSSTVADGIGQVDFWAAFLRLGWRLGQSYHIDINGGALLGGTITIEDQDANELGESDYDPAPFVGATFRGRF